MKELYSLKNLISKEENLVKEYNNNTNEYEKNISIIEMSDGALKEYYITQNSSLSVINDELYPEILKVRQKIKKYFID